MLEMSYQRQKFLYTKYQSLKGGYIGLDNDTMQVFPNESKFVN